MSAPDDDVVRRFPGAARVTVDDSSAPPLMGGPLAAPKRTRLRMADVLIARDKSLGINRTDEDIYAEVGFRSADEYWNDATSEQSGFEHRLMIHFLSPTLKDVGWYEQDLEDAWCFAAENGEPWIREVNGKKAVTQPREAAEWLLSQPTREHLVPSGLKAFLASRKSGEKTPPLPKKAPRRRPGVDRVKDLMKKMDLAKLNSLTEKAMAAQFKADRATCSKARREVLSEPK